MEIKNRWKPNEAIAAAADVVRLQETVVKLEQKVQNLTELLQGAYQYLFYLNPGHGDLCQTEYVHEAQDCPDVKAFDNFLKQIKGV